MIYAGTGVRELDVVDAEFRTGQVTIDVRTAEATRHHTALSHYGQDGVTLASRNQDVDSAFHIHLDLSFSCEECIGELLSLPLSWSIDVLCARLLLLLIPQG